MIWQRNINCKIALKNEILEDTLRTAKSRKTRLHALQIGDFCNDYLLRHFNMVWEFRNGEIILKKDIANH